MSKTTPRHMDKARVLIVDDDQDFRWMLKQLITDDGYSVVEADNGETALRVLQQTPVGLLLLDWMTPLISGLDVLRRLRELSLTMPVIVITGFGSLDAASQAGHYGICGFLTKPIKNDEVLYAMRVALECHRCHVALPPAQSSETTGLDLQEIMGSSAAVKKIAAQIEHVAQTDFTVLITGETGVGKDVVATALHRQSRRAAGPFKAVDCGSIPSTLIESELFGHEKGAFTGADRSRPGCFETAAGGTLFLDEIGNLSLPMQAKLLRALQERQIYRVGGNTPIPLNVRILAATNSRLGVLNSSGEAQVAAVQFRRDLYYRLDEFSICVPPLRERAEDILFLAHRFLQATCKELRKSIPAITADAAHLLRTYSWPGNVRELRNFIRRAALFADCTITCEHLHLAGLFLPQGTACVCDAQFDLTGTFSFRELLRRGISTTEREILLQVIRQTSGNMKQAAQLLHMDYKTLRTKAKQYGLKKPL